MSSSNITHSDKHKNAGGHLGTKNETHNKTGNHEKHDSINHSTVHGIKDSKKYVPLNTHMRKAHTIAGEQAYETTKHHVATNTHRKTTTYGHSDTRGIFKQTSLHKQRMDKHDTIEHDKTNPDKTDHPEIDNAVFISISTAPEETPPENPDTTDQNQS